MTLQDMQVQEPMQKRLVKINCLLAGGAIALVVISVLLILPFRNLCQRERSLKKEVYSAASAVLDAAARGDIQGILKIEPSLSATSERKQAELSSVASNVRNVSALMRFSLWFSVLLAISSFVYLVRVVTSSLRRQPRPWLLILLSSFALVVASVFVCAREIDELRAKKARICAIKLHITYGAALKLKEIAGPGAWTNPFGLFKSGLSVSPCTYEIAVDEFSEQLLYSNMIVAHDAVLCHIERPFELRIGRNVLFGDGHVAFVPEEDFRHVQRLKSGK